MKSPTIRFALLLLGWAALASAFALSGAPQRVTPGAIPAVVFGLATTAIVASRRIGWMRTTMTTLSTRALLSFHLIRFVGATFLWQAAHGRLPTEFAARAGWGDIAAATGALALLLWPEGIARRRLLLGWSIFGALDLFVAVGTATQLTFAHDPLMGAIVTFPLAIVPLCLVPLLLATHAESLRRARRGTTGGPILATA